MISIFIRKWWIHSNHIIPKPKNYSSLETAPLSPKHRVLPIDTFPLKQGSSNFKAHELSIRSCANSEIWAEVSSHFFPLHPFFKLSKRGEKRNRKGASSTHQITFPNLPHALRSLASVEDDWLGFGKENIWASMLIFFVTYTYNSYFCLFSTVFCMSVQKHRDIINKYTCWVMHLAVFGGHCSMSSGTETFSDSSLGSGTCTCSPPWPCIRAQHPRCFFTSRWTSQAKASSKTDNRYGLQPPLFF